MLAVWKQSCCILQAFFCIERFCAASRFKCLITKACYQKDIDRLKDHSSETDGRANGIPFKDKGSKSLKTRFGRDVTRLDNSVHPPEECKHKNREEISCYSNQLRVIMT